MAKKTINLGTPPSGVGGDTARAAFEKVNSNFDELYAADEAIRGELSGKADEGAVNTALATKQPKDATLTALAALVTAANKLVYATGEDQFDTTDLTEFARSLLGDANAAAVRGRLGLKSGSLADILGTVSQSGGIPTGSIIERGSNANGRYVRFADGTQICQRSVLFNGSGAREQFVEYTWPAAFVSNVYGVFLQPKDYGYLVTAIKPAAKQGTGVNTTNITNSSSITVSAGDSFDITVTAIGRWY